MYDSKKDGNTRKTGTLAQFGRICALHPFENRQKNQKGII